MLNYAYAVLEGQLRIAVATAGLDPSIGVMHASKSGRSALLLDLMEPLRPLADLRAFDLIAGDFLRPSDFTIGKYGVVRLHPELARGLVSKLGSFVGISQIVGRVKAILTGSRPDALGFGCGL